MNIQNLFSNLSVGFFKNREVTETPQTQEQEAVQEQTQAEESELQEVELAEEELVETPAGQNVDPNEVIMTTEPLSILLGGGKVKPKPSNPMMQMMMKLMEMMMKLLQMMMGQQEDTAPEEKKPVDGPIKPVVHYAIPELD